MMASIKVFVSAGFGALIATGVFFLLWLQISGPAHVGERIEATRINFSRMRHDTKVETKRDEEVERELPPPTPAAPQISLAIGGAQGAVARIAPAVDVSGALRKMHLTAGSDRDVLPLVRIPPDYPPRALSRGVEGWVRVRFTITPTGTVKAPRVVSADPPDMFDDAALKAIARWRYNPRIEGGVATERVGVETVIRFELEK
jgi:periplasmic protein TonB